MNKIYAPNHNSEVGLPVGLCRKTTRPPISVRLTRAVDAGITRLQEWLETDDTAGQKVVVLAMIGICAAYIIGHLIGRLF